MELRIPSEPGIPHPVTITLDRHGDFVAFYEIIVERCYEPLLRRIAPGDVVVDAGANIGLFSMLASNRVGCQGTVLAIEPNPENLERLASHVRRNGLTNVRTIPCAVAGPNDTEVRMAGDGIRGHVVEKTEGSYSVRANTLDGLAREQGLRPTILKMDIEGSEREAFRGLSESLPNLRAVSIEIHDRGAEEVVRSALTGFRIERLERSGFSPYVRFGIRHPILLSRLERHNRFLSLRRVLRDRGDVSGNVGGFPTNWLAYRTV